MSSVRSRFVLRLCTTFHNWYCPRCCVADQRGLVPQLKEASARFDRMAKNRDLWTNKFLRFPEQSKGEIWSGRALNHFLAQCGPTAVQHEFLHDALEKERRNLEDLLGKTS